jgi:hypothetical protein
MSEKRRASLFSATVARRDGESWWLMNRPDKGWSSFGYRYASLGEIEAAWAVTFGKPGRDQCSEFVEVIPA